MHFALQNVLPSAEVVAAFDINDLANDVYEHNFNFRPKQVPCTEVEQTTRIVAVYVLFVVMMEVVSQYVLR